MNISKIEDDIFFGSHAEALISNPAYQAAITRIKARIFDQWTKTGAFQSKERKDLWRLSRVVNDFEQELELMIRDAKIAREDLKQSERNVK